MPTTTITTAGTVTGLPIVLHSGTKELNIIGDFVFGSGGSICKVFIQTRIGTTWTDIMNLTFLLASAKKIAFVRRDTLVLSDGDKKKDQNQVILTPTDGALADDMILSGLLGLDIRAKIISTGTYAGGTTITVEGN